MKTTLWKTTVREIKSSLGRFLAILAIVALGVGMFAGLKVTQPFVLQAGEKYYEKHDFFDFHLLSSYGLEAEDVAYLAGQPHVKTVEGAYSYDVLAAFDGTENASVIKVHNLPGGVNGVELLYGEMPKKANECVVDSRLYGEEAIGTTVVISNENEEETLEVFAQREFTISGIVQSSLYLQFERGNTSLGNGQISGFVYVPLEAFNSEIYTEAYVKLDKKFPLYSQEYDDYIDALESDWERSLQEAADARFGRIKADAEAELNEAKEEYYREKADAEKELADASAKLSDGEQELADAAREIEDAKHEIADAKEEIADGYIELSKKERELLDGEAELLENEQMLLDKENELADAKEEWEDGSEELNRNREKLEEAKYQLEQQEAELLKKEQELVDQESQTRMYLAMIQMDPVKNQQMIAMVEAGLAEIEAGKSQLEAGKVELAASKVQIEEGLNQIEFANNQLASAIMQIWDGERQLAEGKEELDKAKAEIADGKEQIADARRKLRDAESEIAEAEAELADGEAEYQDGLLEYRDGLKEYQEGLAEFEEEITEAEAEIADAEKEIAELEGPEIYVLNRDTNMGYMCLENDSGIVADVAVVFPVFFFLVAALVCMTTMNRMIEEQRTQIGVFKALGYSNSAIMGKYLVYSGSAAFIGCVGGFFLGTYFLPIIIWDAYGIMYNGPTLSYFIDWPLAIISLAASLTCSMGVTWLSCRMELREVAAALMRPKAPMAGKRVIFEYIPFLWKRIKFLQKVSIRNVLRYKRRFFMMIIGISGCTALIVAAFGILDSVKNVVTMQYEEIVFYDMSVSFKEEPSEEVWRDYLEISEGQAEETDRFLETSLDMRVGDKIKSVSLIVPSEPDKFKEYVDLHTDEQEPIEFPGAGEVVICQKLADQFQLSIGDIMELVDEDQKSFTVKVSDICSNYVFNYVYLHPDTCRQMWKEPEFKTAYIHFDEELKDVYAYSAALLDMDETVNVTINMDVRERFENMMSSLNYIVFVIILCAAALAFIVLYNLTNINVTERVREIATIKVLGFTKRETASYVFRENMILTILGGAIGLLLGKVFHAFIMSCISLDAVTFDERVTGISFLYSFGLTLVFAGIVNWFMTGKIERISMTESLKSVD